MYMNIVDPDTGETFSLERSDELSKDLKQFWQQNSRPNSPAPSMFNGTPGNRSPLGWRAERAGNRDFEAGYAMGLIGGVKSWMQGSRRKNLSGSRVPSDDEEEEGDSEDSGGGKNRGRRLGKEKEEDEAEGEGGGEGDKVGLGVQDMETEN